MTDYKKRLDEQYKEIFRHKSKQGLTLLTQRMDSQDENFSKKKSITASVVAPSPAKP